ncbi:MAG TPA: FtsX-like permease family protein [Candidatus Saccharimonadales bacterium]|nr:FtsX-like permease family protein [Candidatus Saccharimonadales bacterium]
MLLIALRNLFQEKSRLLISVGGVAFAIILMVALFGIYNGAIERDVKFLKESPSDIFVMRKGMTDMYHGVPLVSLTDIERLGQEDGVSKVVPVISLRPGVSDGDTQFSLFVTSFDPTDLSQGPWALTSGTKNITDGEIIIPGSLAKKLGKKLGDTIVFSESAKVWRIAGLVPEASSFGNHYSWITYHAAQDFVEVPGTVSFAYITLFNPSTAAGAAQSLQPKYPQLSLRGKDQLVTEEKKNLGDSFLPILQAILAIAVLIGTAIIGLTIYTATLDKSREVGILKAIGVRNSQLYSIVLTQSMLTTALGLVIGIGLSFGVGWLISNLLDLSFVVTDIALITVVGLAFIMGILASLIPVRRLAFIDPAEVFKS